MKVDIIKTFGKEDLAYVYLAKLNDKGVVEFVESLQPPFNREQKWVLILSVSYGCPVKCVMCDAKIEYKGNLTAEEIISQAQYMTKKRFIDNKIPIPKFKIQFARMGEPAFNKNVLEVLMMMSEIYDAPGLTPCVSTIAPENTDDFFGELLAIKNKYYKNKFQLQFSIHTTDFRKRDEIMPVKKWDFGKIARYGKEFKEKDNKKITLNFALAETFPVDARIIKEYFDPELFLIKVTPLNPTVSALRNNLISYIDPLSPEKQYAVIEDFRDKGYEVILSIGENEENHIGSNCGQYVTEYLTKKDEVINGYRTNAYNITR